jgi:hypothetical protein
VSALRRTPAGRLELRVFNPTGEDATVTVAGRSGERVDLRGRPLGPFSDRFELGAHGIATVVLDE